MASSKIPQELAESWQIIHGYSISIRPLRRTDLEIESDFLEGLSQETRYNRLLGGAIKLSRAYLEQLTSIDYSRDMALAAVVMTEDSEVLIGVARYVMDAAGDNPRVACEFAIVVADAWQGRGIGWRMLLKLIDVARARGLTQTYGDILSINHPMLTMVKRLGFRTSRRPDDATITRATLDLG
ncbi:MAG: GNAT family N-acetyltransferase [Betaproteobacteria bacterium]|nr:GNAT family N-acetyltransferase [Betaproteobacteria bacterium]